MLSVCSVEMRLAQPGNVLWRPLSHVSPHPLQTHYLRVLLTRAMCSCNTWCLDHSHPSDGVWLFFGDVEPERCGQPVGLLTHSWGHCVAAWPAASLLLLLQERERVLMITTSFLTWGRGADLFCPRLHVFPLQLWLLIAFPTPASSQAHGSPGW